MRDFEGAFLDSHNPSYIIGTDAGNEVSFTVYPTFIDNNGLTLPRQDEESMKSAYNVSLKYDSISISAPYDCSEGVLGFLEHNAVGMMARVMLDKLVLAGFLAQDSEFYEENPYLTMEPAGDRDSIFSTADPQGGSYDTELKVIQYEEESGSYLLPFHGEFPWIYASRDYKGNFNSEVLREYPNLERALMNLWGPNYEVEYKDRVYDVNELSESKYPDSWLTATEFYETYF